MSVFCGMVFQVDETKASVNLENIFPSNHYFGKEKGKEKCFKNKLIQMMLLIIKTL